MGGTSERPVRMQVTDSGDMLAKQRLCFGRQRAWQQSCGSRARVNSRLVSSKMSKCASAGKGVKSNLRLIHTPADQNEDQNRVTTNLPAIFIPARAPDGYPFYRPGVGLADASGMRVPPVLWQTGRGSSPAEHNNASTAADELAAELLGRGLERVWHNDSAARAFVALHCPRALGAYDCLKPHAYQADVWRYCVMYAKGGFYLDAEDVPLVELRSLVRPCDALVLANDLCPDFSPKRKKEVERGAHPPVQLHRRPDLFYGGGAALALLCVLPRPRDSSRADALLRPG